MANSINNETQLHAQCFQWFWNTYPSERKMLFHVQQKASNAIEGNKFKAMGVVTGVSDLVYIGKEQVAFIELKFDKGKQSIDQEDFEKKVTARGHCYFLIRTFEQFQNLMRCLTNQ